MNKSLSIIVICFSIILSISIASFTYYAKGRSNDTISVAGMGKVDIKSDHAVWHAELIANGDNIKRCYTIIEAHKKLLSSYITNSGINQTEFKYNALRIEEINERDYSPDEKKYLTSTNYKLHQEFTIDSYDTEKVEKLYGEISVLTKDDLQITSDTPIYFYSKLPELKLQLISLAANDAKKRAEEIAKVSGVGLGKLRNSTTGVFQIYGQNVSPDPDW